MQKQHSEDMNSNTDAFLLFCPESTGLSSQISWNPTPDTRSSPSIGQPPCFCRQILKSIHLPATILTNKLWWLLIFLCVCVLEKKEREHLDISCTTGMIRNTEVRTWCHRADLLICYTWTMRSNQLLKASYIIHNDCLTSVSKAPMVSTINGIFLAS